MNKKQLRKLAGRHVRLRPIVERIDIATGLPLEILDRRWWVELDNQAGLALHSRTGHRLALPWDHIRGFISDPNNPDEGFLNLTVQHYMSGDNIWFEPLDQRPIFTNHART